MVVDRAVFFIDGNNWYHSLVDVGVDDRARLDYAKISEKLAGPRDWIETRYYIGAVPQNFSPSLYADQRRFFSSLTNTDSRISVHRGRLEPRPVKDPAATELRRCLANLNERLPSHIYKQLMEIATKKENSVVMVEKAVDVGLAVDLVDGAINDIFDAAYILSADGDFTPAVEVAKRHGKKIFAVSPLNGAQLASAADAFIKLTPDWFKDCYK